MSAQDERIKALSEEEADKLLIKEHFRKRINEIICEYVGTVDFMKKMREYAGMEIDSRIFRSFYYWVTLIITAVITSAIGFGISQWLSHK